jgi:hypothetical protein
LSCKNKTIKEKGTDICVPLNYITKITTLVIQVQNEKADKHKTMQMLKFVEEEEAAHRNRH